MGVLYSDVVRALFPEHAAPGHELTILPPKKLFEGPAGWKCSCGHEDVLIQDDEGGEVGRALRAGLVTRT